MMGGAFIWEIVGKIRRVKEAKEEAKKEPTVG
jgi:hypothetical protein